MKDLLIGIGVGTPATLLVIVLWSLVIGMATGITKIRSEPPLSPKVFDGIILTHLIGTLVLIIATPVSLSYSTDNWWNCLAIGTSVLIGTKVGQKYDTWFQIAKCGERFVLKAKSN